jgi:hypothetical protein
MSLRTQIHDAIDDVTPPAPHLESRVAMYVVAGGRERPALRLRPRRSPWTNRIQGVAALLAAVLVIALIVGLVFGGRLLRDLNHTPAPAINQTELKKLEAVPLRLSLLAGNADCRTGPLTAVRTGQDMYGDGPVYVQSSSDLARSSWGTWQDFYYTARPGHQGLVLVRARDLRTGGVVVFARVPGFGYNVDDGIPTGRSAGTDQVFTYETLHAYSEEAINVSNLPASHPSYSVPGWPGGYMSYVGYPKAGSGCVGMQIDGSDFSETVVVSY